MPETKKFHCLNCGEDFDLSVLNKEEAAKARLSGQPLDSIRCPKCKRSDCREE